MKQLFLLGAVRVQDGDDTIDQFRSHRAVALLIYLVSQPQAVPRSELVELIWRDKPEKRGRANLRWALNYLGKLLPDCWVVSRQTAQFEAQNCWVDLWHLAEALATDDVAGLETALTSTPSEFCRGFYFDESSEFETWLLTQREQWREQISTAYQRLIDYYSQRGENGRALAFARQLLALDTWQENAHRQVMRLLAQAGQFDEALAQYETCRQLLADELQISPTKQTSKLADRIAALRERPRHNLPAQPTPFVSREADLYQLTTLLADPVQRLVTIVAPGGMGKTRLALAAAAAQSSAFLEGVAFISLAPIDSATMLAATMVQVLSRDGFIEPQQGHRTAVDYLLDVMAELELLLVLDNYEQLLPDVSLLLAILDRAPQVKLLVTSRERLNTRWERPFAIDGLTYPQTDADDGQDYSAPQLFWQTAQRVQPGYVPTPADETAVIEICRLVEGMPLAIELAATWMRVQTPPAIATAIADDLAILQTHQRDLPDRRRSIHAIFDQTWARLSATEQKVLAWLSVFRGTFSFAAAQAVAEADWQVLAALMDKSLLRRRPLGEETATAAGSVQAVYYDMHELLRQYAAEHLMEQAAVAEVRQQHEQYYAELLATYETDLLIGDKADVVLKQMELEIDNIRAAWEWALSTKHGASLNQMVESMYRFYWYPSLVRDGQAMMAAAVAQLADMQTEDEALWLAYGRMLERQGAFTWLLHEDYAEAERLVRQSLEILEKLAAKLDLAKTWHTLANILYTDDLEAGRHYWQRSLAIYEEVGNTRQQAIILRNLCVTAATHMEMMKFWDPAMATAVAANDQRNEAHLYFIRGGRDLEVGHLATAQEMAQKSVDMIRALDDPPHLILALNVLTHIFIEQEKLTEARLLLQEMQEIAGRLAITWHSLLVRLAFGRWAIAAGRFEEAEHHLKAVEAEPSQEGSFKNLRQQLYFLQGQLQLQQGNYTAARENWQRCWQTLESSDFLVNSGRWRAQVGIAESWLCEGVWETAISHLQKAQEIANRIGANIVWQQELDRLRESYPELMKHVTDN